MPCLCPDELTFHRFTLSHSYFSAFATSPWLPLPLFLIYRLIAGFYLLSWLIYSGFTYGNYWFLYFSNWVFMFVTAHFLMAMFITTHYCCGSGVEDDPAGFGPRRFKSETYIVGLSFDDENDEEGEGTTYAKPEVDDNELTFWYKVSWLLFTIASVNSLVASFAYWTSDYSGGEINGVTANENIVASVLMLFEVTFSNIPIRLLHFIYSHVFGSTYVLFTVIYWAAGGKDKEGNRYIYTRLNYEKYPEEAILTVFIMLIILQFMMHLFNFLLFRFRTWLVSKMQ